MIFNINTPINNEVKHQKSKTVIKLRDKYPMLCKRITRKVGILAAFQEFLADCGINKTENKDTLVTNAYNACKMNPEISATDYIEEQNDVDE